MENQKTTEQAADEFFSSLSTLGSAIAKNMKSKAMTTVQETFDSAEDRVKEVVDQYNPQYWIKDNPRAAVMGAFAAGLLLAWKGRMLFTHPLALAGVNLGVELLRSGVQKNMRGMDDMIGSGLH